MKTVRPALAHPADAGLTLIEILIAMMIFAIIALGVAYSLASTLNLASDGRAREIATNLAAQDIDLSQSVETAFTLVDKDTTSIVNGTTFRLHRSTNWVSSAGATGNCGAGGGQLQYKRVNVTVTWDGMRSTTPAVRADSVIAPGSKINDPTRGTILVSVLGASGAGSPNVTVAAAPSSPANGAATLADAPAATDAQGCSYILKVKPGTYDVTVTRPGFVDSNQAATSVKTVGVAAGAAASVAFQYDLAGAFTAQYASNVPIGTALIPKNMDTTFRNTYGSFVSAATSSSLSRTVYLHPFPAGYQALAGKYVVPTAPLALCLSIDPAAWTTPAPDGAVGPTPASVATGPGGSATMGVPMGVVTVNALLPGQFLKAVSQAAAPGTGDPGCAATSTYYFDPPAGASAQLALPYGTWKLYSGPTPTLATLPVAVTALNLVTRGLPVTIPGTGFVTLDPRTVVVP